MIYTTRMDIKEIRESLKLSQSALATQLRVSPSTVGMWEQGRRPVPPDIVAKLLGMRRHQPQLSKHGRSFSSPLYAHIPQDYAERIRNYRMREGLSQEQLAQRLGMADKNGVSRWEIGRNRPQFAQWKKFVALEGV
jgi:DNA-binding transcriptional regulator YiaG